MLHNHLIISGINPKDCTSAMGCAATHAALIAGRMCSYGAEFRNEDREVERRIGRPVGTFMCHIDDLDVSDSITVAC